VRLSRRRTEDPVAAYVGILDGRHLWLTLESGGTAELHGQGRVIPLGEITDLLDIPVGDYRVLAGGQPVRARPFTDDAVRVPVSPDGRSQLVLERDEDGHLAVGRREEPPTAVLEAIELRGADVHLTLDPPGDVEQGSHLVLLDADDQVLDQLPVTAHDGHVEALLGVADLPAGYFGVIRLALGTEAGWVRIRRRASDLADAHKAVLLPELHDVTDDDDAEPRARFRWNPDSQLVVRVLEPAELAGPDATVTPIGGAS
jgi:hypothetical protein